MAELVSWAGNYRDVKELGCHRYDDRFWVAKNPVNFWAQFSSGLTQSRPSRLLSHLWSFFRSVHIEKALISVKFRYAILKFQKDEDFLTSVSECKRTEFEFVLLFDGSL